MKELEFDSHAVVEVEEALAHYDSIDPSLANDLEATIASAIQLIKQRPSTWPVYAGNTRRLILRRFPYALIYREGPTTLTLVAFAHHRRKPGYWSGRF